MGHSLDMCETVYLTAITLSQSASLAIAGFRRGLFRKYGVVSAMALPALVPLAWQRERPIDDRQPFLTLPSVPLQPAGFRQEKQHLYLELSAAKGGDHTFSITRDWVEIFSSDTEGCFPLVPAVYICSGLETDKSLGKQDFTKMDSLQSITVDDFRLACFRIRYRSDCPWWEDLEYTRLWSKHIRK